MSRDIRRSMKSRSTLSAAVSPWSSRRRTSVVVDSSSPKVRPTILGLSTAFEAGGQVAPLDATTRQASVAVHERLSADGLRVLAVAYRWLEPRDAYSRDDEVELVFAGFVSFADPVLPDVADVLAELKRDGVTVKILIGDNELVARHVCRSIALDDQQIVTGDDIARIDDAARPLAGVRDIVDAAVGSEHALLLKRDGTVIGWGHNAACEVGNGDPASKVKNPDLPTMYTPVLSVMPR